jgi:predicted nucleic acid-binding protein
VTRVAVVDTSVAAKWFLDEPNAPDALRLLDDRWELHAPDFLDLELDHLLAKRFRRGELTKAEGASIRAALAEFPIHRHYFHDLQDAAFDLACRHRRGVYDSLFVALALYLGTKLVTADRRLYDASSHRPGVGDSLLWVGDITSVD